MSFHPQINVFVSAIKYIFKTTLYSEYKIMFYCLIDEWLKININNWSKQYIQFCFDIFFFYSIQHLNISELHMQLDTESWHIAL